MAFYEPTVITKAERLNFAETVYLVNTEKSKSFMITAIAYFNDYLLRIRPYESDTTLSEIAKFAYGCFKRGNNFFSSMNFYRRIDWSRVILDYEGVSIIISEEDYSVSTIIKRWEKAKELKAKEIYYIIGLRKDSTEGYAKYLVLAASKENAIKKAKEAFGVPPFLYEGVCFGKYYKKTNKLIIEKNADLFFDLHPFSIIEMG